MQPLELIAAARLLLKDEAGEANVRRAVSSAYYALFHMVAREIADSVVPALHGVSSEKAWRLAYRGLEHAALRNACKNPDLLRGASPAIKQMTDIVARMQIKRHLADYEPRSDFKPLNVEDDIRECEAAIHAFTDAPEADRRAFVAFVLFKTR